MIKGVNKKVIEVNDPRSIYFEKAVMYLRPNLSSVSAKLLKAEAQHILHSMSPTRSKYNALKKTAIALACFAAGFFGASCAFLIFEFS
ncbi:MAG: hypothetical protein NC320_11380 [Clostridium sp.]|nr:hypothetical protein [Clostridium sp.]MCM1548196.1 hypothetical protein [Ruminococcus sp.]